MARTPADAPDTSNAQGRGPAERAATRIRDAITRTVTSAPPLTGAQRDRLATLLRPTIPAAPPSDRSGTPPG